MYDPDPVHWLPDGVLDAGFDGWAARLPSSGIVRIDGFLGIEWESLRCGLAAALRRRGVEADWRDCSSMMRKPEEVEALVGACVNQDLAPFGRRWSGQLVDLFEPPDFGASWSGTGLTIFLRPRRGHLRRRGAALLRGSLQGGTVATLAGGNSAQSRCPGDSPTSRTVPSLLLRRLAGAGRASRRHSRRCGPVPLRIRGQRSLPGLRLRR